MIFVQLYTLGMKYYPGYRLPVVITEDLAVFNEGEARGYYKVIYIKSGTSHFIINQQELILTGTYAMCMNEWDDIRFCEAPKEPIRILLFQPSVINASFTVDKINCTDTELSLTESQDLFYLEPFMHKAGLDTKIISLRTMDASVIDMKLQLIKGTLVNQESGSWPCMSRSYLFEVLFALARQKEKDEPVPSIQFYNGCSRLAVDVIYYLQSCYNQKITIDRLTEEFHTNRTTLLSDFKKYTGQSINHYLVQLRLNMASTLLRDTELSVDEICDRTGFSDISYFSKVFKKGLSLTPSEYRKIYSHVSH